MQKLREEVDGDVSLEDEVNTDDSTDGEEPKGSSNDGYRKSNRLQQIKSSRASSQPSQPKVKKSASARQAAASNKKKLAEKSELEKIKQDRLNYVIRFFYLLF